MPARRPYASRGVPRRATTRRSNGAGSSAGLAALVALLIVIAAGVVWLVDPFGSSQQIAGRPGFILLGERNTGPGAAAGSGESGAQALQMAEVAVPGATTTAARPGRAPTSLPTVRQWDAAASGVIWDAALVSRLDQALAAVDGHVSVAVKDLGSGRGAVLDGDRELPAASLYKLPVLFSVFEAGLSMGEELPITEEAHDYDSGTMELGVGESLTVAEALERMVTISDNTAAVMLGSRTGGGRINADVAALGMDATHYGLERMTTSAADMLRFLDLLAHGQMVSASASADMVHLLLRQRVNDRLPRLLPSGVEVAHKTGNLPGTVNDVGIIYGPTSTLAVAALVSDTTDETTAASGIAQVALAAYTYFADQPESADRPTLPRPPVRAIPPVWRAPRPVPTVALTPPPDEPTPAPSGEATPIPPPGRGTAIPASGATSASGAVSANGGVSANTAVPGAASTPPPTAFIVAATATPVPAPATPTSGPAAATRTPPRSTALSPVAPATATPPKR